MGSPVLLVGVGVRLAMQLAMNASHAPLRCGRVACCACLKQKSSISLGAAEAGFMLVNARKVTATNTHFGFKVLAPTLNLTTIIWLKREARWLNPASSKFLVDPDVLDCD
jgi:hypothetical protein